MTCLHSCGSSWVPKLFSFVVVAIVVVVVLVVVVVDGVTVVG